MQEYRKRSILSAVRRAAFVVALFSSSTISPQRAPAPVSATSVRTTAHLVLVDVVVYDHQGNHVTNLTAADFTLRDRGKPQKISVFSNDHDGESPTDKSSSPPPLPPGVSTNRPVFDRSQGTPSILLLDGLNTANGNQLYSRDALLQYLRKQLNEGQKIAILSLKESVGLLQGFASDPRLLIAALDKSKSETSNESSDATIQTFTLNEAGTLPPGLLHLIKDKSRAAKDPDGRTRVTLAALRSIARAFGGFPGRKNLIWVSTVFPFDLQPESGAYPDAQRVYGEDIRPTAAMLSAAQVAVYPVDARDLIVGDVHELRLNDSAGLLTENIDHQFISGEIANSYDATVGAHQVMKDLAAATGGLPFYNHDDVMRAVALSAADGGQYYTLGYYPEGGRSDLSFHSIEVKVDREGVMARQRSGYFAVDVTRKTASENRQQRDRRAYDELRAALADPLPATQVTFRSHITPIAAAPKLEVQIQFLVDTSAISFEAIENGGHHCSLDFMVAAVSPDGKTVASDGHTVDARLTPDQFAKTNQNGLPFTMQLPLVPGQYSIRMAVRDNRTGQIGTLSLPLLVQTP